MSAADVARAEAKVAAAREKLLGSTQALQARLKPSVLADDAWNVAREKGQEVAAEAVRAVKERPIISSAAAIGLAAFVARRPIAKLFGMWRGKDK
ncbi:MAG: DUF3618 domain-containing protein [Sphingomonas sp.]|nr:DUF3618 domain-containing protein [Sphingomonas sp.]